MPRDVRTDLTLSLKTQGFGQGQQELARVTRDAQKAIDQQVKGFESSGKAMGAVEKEVKRLEGVLQGFAKRQAAINQLMEELGDKATPEYKALAAELKNVDREAQRVSRTISSLDRAFSRQREQRQGFAQGLMQGLAPGAMTFLQRGPGMRQQMMGAALGGAARGGVRAAGTTLTGGMFSGAEGVVQGISQMPLVGGIMGPAASRALAQAQQKMQAQQVQLQTMPFLGGIGLRGEAARAEARARATVTDREINRQAQRDRLHESLIPTPDHYRQARAEVGRQREEHVREKVGRGMPGGGLLGVGRDLAREDVIGEAGGRAGIEEQIEARAMQISGAEAEARTRRNLERERSRRGRAARRGVMGRLGLGAGVSFGMDINAERQFRAQVMQAGGGTGLTEQGQRMGVTAMAAQTAFGVGPGVAGAFLQAGRRGGLAGAEGDASRMFTESIADAFKLGLSEAEMNVYLQQMASGIETWKTTGIPFNKQSMADIAGTLGTMGMGGVRGMAVAGGISRAAEQLSRTGPQSVGQLMMLQTMGGLKPGQTGMEAMEDALIRLEKKEGLTGEKMKTFISQLISAGGGGAMGRRVAFGVLKDFGISREELKAFDEGADETTLARIREERAEGARRAKVLETPEGLARATRAAVPAALKEQAELTNRQIANGKNLIESMSQLNDVAQTMTELITEKLAPLFEFVGVNLKDLVSTAQRQQLASFPATDPTTYETE
jgi:hypothetical protein